MAPLINGVIVTTSIGGRDRRNLIPPPLWNGSFRWFRSPNIVDLWHYRSPTEKRRITDFMWRRQLNAV
jgi:hypothetical protein